MMMSVQEIASMRMSSGSRHHHSKIKGDIDSPATTVSTASSYKTSSRKKKSSSKHPREQQQQQQLPFSSIPMEPPSPAVSGSGSYYSTPVTYQERRQKEGSTLMMTTKQTTKKKKKKPRSSEERRSSRRPPRAERSVRSYDETTSNKNNNAADNSTRRRRSLADGQPEDEPSTDQQPHPSSRTIVQVMSGTTTSTSSSLYPSTGLDHDALLERLQRLSCHLAESMVTTLLDQMDREEAHAHNVATKKQQQQQQQPLTETEKLRQLQEQMVELERKSDHEQHHFELELDDSTNQLLLDDGSSSTTSASDDESSSYEECFNSSIYDIMPLAGDGDDASRNAEEEIRIAHAIIEKDRQRQKLSDFLEKTEQEESSTSEQLVTKIGQTRLNRTLRKTSTSVVGDNHSVANTSVSENDSSQQPSQNQQFSATTNNNKFRHGIPSTSSKHSFASMPAELDHGSSHGSVQGLTSNHLAVAAPKLEADDDLLCDSHKSAICLVDISGFTNLSRCLNVEDLSKTINKYFQRIVDLIHWHGGDVLKFAGDALIVEWKEVKNGRQRVTSWQAVLNAATCASRIVDSCCDFPVRDASNHLISTLNVHVGLGYGHVMACSVGDLQRREYLILGETIQQVADAMTIAKQGEVVASAEAYALLNETSYIVNPSVFEDDGTSPQIIACKTDQYFKPKDDSAGSGLPGKTDQQLELMERVNEWSLPVLERLLARMSSYVHPAVLNQEVDGANETTAAATRARRRGSMDASQHNTAEVAVDAELREVFTTFIQPDVDVKQIMGSEVKLETVELLQQLMLIVTSEVVRFKGHVRQFIVDDKGLVIIANFGLRGSTFPNMVEERGLPCISNIRKLVKTELELECRVGATFGKAYCGIVGAGNRHEYAVLGSPVNLAARLMAAKDNNGILVDEAVKMKASHQPFQSLEPVKAKGYDNPVKIFQPHESVRKSWKSLSSNFVGRNEEMGSIAQSAKMILKYTSHSEMMFLTGPYGVGKSLVLSHALNRVKRACSQALKTCYSSSYVFCDEDSFKPFSILRPLFLDLMRGKQTININMPSAPRRSGSFQSKRSSSVDSDPVTGSLTKRNPHGTLATFSLGGNDSVKSGSTASFNDDACYDGDESGMGGHVDEKMLNLELLKICLECGIPMNYVEVFGGLIFTNKLSDIGSWADRGQKQSEWDQIARYIVKAFLHITVKYDLVVLALDEVGGMDEMSWKIIELLYHQSKNLLLLCAARSQFDINIPEEFWDALNDPDAKHFTHRALPNMENRETMQLVHKKLDRKMAGLHERELQGIAKTVHILSSGNPLMATEILNKLYLKFTPEEEENLENLGYIGELLMNRLDSLSANVLNHLNLGALLGASFHLDEVVTVMASYNQVPDDAMAAHSIKVEAALKVAVDNGILFLSTTSNSLYFFNKEGSGRPFDLDELVDERMKSFNLPTEERASSEDLVWSILEKRVNAGILRKQISPRTTYTFSHEFWQKCISWRTLDSWKNEMLRIKGELDEKKRATRTNLMG